MTHNGWKAKNEVDRAEEHERAAKAIELWELKLRKARTEKDRRLARKRINYWMGLL